MPAIVDLSSEAAITTIVTDTFLKSVKRNIGFDPETPNELIPVDLEELLHECIGVCEKEQWRFILEKSVKLLLPFEAFCKRDQLLFLPFGPVTELDAFTYTKSDATTGSVLSSSYTIYPGEPAKIWSADWSEVFDDLDCVQPYPITLTYTTGYPSYDAVPKSTIRALKILAYHFFEFRDAVADGSVMELPQGYCSMRDLSMLNDRRAIQYVAEDWMKVSRG